MIPKRKKKPPEWKLESPLSLIENKHTATILRDSLAKAMEKGLSFSAWRTEVEALLSPKDIAALSTGQLEAIFKTYRITALETIFRTYIQTAYAARDEKETNKADPDGDMYPRYQYITSQQEGVCPICKPRHGMVFKRDDDLNKPPLHPNCACTIGYISQFGKQELSPEEKRNALPPPAKIKSKIDPK